MYVLIDVEWFQQGETTKYITQIAVSRVTETWERTAGFSCLVRPPGAWNCDWEHMAYNGYSPDEFMNGSSEAECIEHFAAFLKKDDTLCVWSKDTKKIILEKYELYIGNTLPNSCVCVNDKVYTAAKNRGINVFEMYAVAGTMGIETPVPKHCSINDISVMTSLLSTLNIEPQKKSQVARPQTTKKVISKQERNADILARVQYNFIFTPASTVFHRPSCKLMLRANDIKGSVYYETAAKNRRPCKLCHPEPNERIAAPKGKPSQSQSPASDKTPQKAIVVAKLLGNQRIQITKSKLVGYCHNVIHPGKLTAKIMNEHDCLGKQCRFFEKYEDSTYWIAQEQKRKEKDKRKAAKQKQKQEAQQIEDELEETRELFQSYADALEYELFIVRLQRESQNHYKVFYVSENRFADGNRFPNFLDTIKHYFPKLRIELRHIRDLDGHFVTIDEYMVRKGKRRMDFPVP